MSNMRMDVFTVNRRSTHKGVFILGHFMCLDQLVSNWACAYSTYILATYICAKQIEIQTTISLLYAMLMWGSKILLNALSAPLVFEV